MTDGRRAKTRVRVVLAACTVLLCGGGRLVHAEVPAWAVGRWQASSLVIGPDILGWGPSGATAVGQMIAATHIEFTSTSFAGARTGLFTQIGTDPATMFLGGAAGIMAREAVAPLRSLFRNGRGHDLVVLGRQFAVEPDAEVAFAALQLSHCIDLGPTPAVRDDQGRLLPGTDLTTCPELRVYRFPDDHHIALPDALGGWVVYEPAGEAR